MSAATQNDLCREKTTPGRAPTKRPPHTSRTMDDDDLEAAASALCASTLLWIIQPSAELVDGLQFANLLDGAKELYRGIVMSVIDVLQDRGCC